MERVSSIDAMADLQVQVRDADVPVIFYFNSTNKHIAFTFQITYSTGATLINNNVVNPGQTFPVYSGSETHTLLGAQYEPD